MPQSRKSGIGKLLIQFAITGQALSEVDVNEQNPQAVGFYLHMGFESVGRSELDGEGNPFPLLHLRLCQRDYTRHTSSCLGVACVLPAESQRLSMLIDGPHFTPTSHSNYFGYNTLFSLNQTFRMATKAILNVCIHNEAFQKYQPSDQASFSTEFTE
ncbi:GNAT family N-acetyltransferase [uncultured Cedecea sp.]|uniref:GNAT family N-acetyltransferase n=1 Tax=uncultured Cedecea sp. TaxID=988762 RepID=UPI00345C9706